MENRKIGTIGVGLMGAGIAEVCARADYDTLVREINDELLAKGLDRIETSMQSAVQRGKLTVADQEAARSRIRGTTRLEDFADRDLVIEAAIEDMGLKKNLFAQLDQICPAHTILTSNTSSIPIIEVATATKRPDRVLGTHFFNPVPAMQLLELVRTSKEDIDVGMMLGTSYPMGPFTLLDFIGLDTALDITEVLFEAFKEPRFAAPTLLRQMVAAGWLGRKSGRGFYNYKAGERPPR